MIRLLTQFGGFSTHYGNVSSEGAVYATQTQYLSPFVGHSRTDLLNSKIIIMWGWDPARMISGSDTIYKLIQVKEKHSKIKRADNFKYSSRTNPENFYGEKSMLVRI